MIKIIALTHGPTDSVAFFSIKMCNKLHILLILLKLLTKPFFDFIYSGYYFPRIRSVLLKKRDYSIIQISVKLNSGEWRCFVKYVLPEHKNSSPPASEKNNIEK